VTTATPAIPAAAPAAVVTAAPPVQLTGFVGREQELETLRELLDSARLVTLTGAGGSGKTRLALEALRRAMTSRPIDFAWIELASLSDPVTLTRHLALVLGVRIDGSGSPEQAIAALLRDRKLLLVLDNCEHLVDECARIVERLLVECPHLGILATSREALGIDGERSWLVPPLSLPPADAQLSADVAGAAEAVSLFVTRARDVQSAFTLTASNTASVVKICRRLDGLPLAIELAAARVNVLTPEQIAGRLDDRFRLLSSRSRSALPRHRTLRAAVDWSYELLSENERLLLERLAVFAGGFTLDAAEGVCAGGAIEESEILDVLASLVTRSLVAMQEEDGRARYRLLETIREYAIERRRESVDATDVSARHAEYFLELAQNLEPDLILGRSQWLRHVDVEHDNFRAALAWSAAHYEGARCGLPLAWALTWYWFHRQLWHEGFHHFERALETATNPQTEHRGAALHALGIFGLYAGHPLSRDRLREAERIWRDIGNLRWLAFTLVCRTTEASLRRDPAEAREIATEATAVAATLGDPWVTAIATVHAMVPVLVWERNWAEAEKQLAESESIYREFGYLIGIAYVLDTQAFVALQRGDHARAAALACASLRTDPQAESRWLAGRSLRTLGAVAFASAEFDRAARLFGAAEGMYDAIGADPLAPERRAVNELTDDLRDRMSAATFAADWHAGYEASFDAAVAFALAAEQEAANESPSATSEITPHVQVETAVSASSPEFEIRALGSLEIRRAGKPLSPDAMRHSRSRELLLYLLVHPQGRSREQVGLAFWPDVSAAQVKNNFHVTLHHLRKVIGLGERVRFDHGRYHIDSNAGVELDAVVFEQRLRDALRRLRAADATDECESQAARELGESLALYRGPFLAGEPFGDWHLDMRDRFARLFEEGLDALAAYHEARGDHAAAVDSLRRLVASDALREDAVRRLMRALTRDERRAEALRIYKRFTIELAEELGIAPEHNSTVLAERIRDGSSV